MAELTRRFLQGRNNLEFYFRESQVSEQPDAIDLVHIPTGLVCLFDDEKARGVRKPRPSHPVPRWRPSVRLSKQKIKKDYFKFYKNIKKNYGRKKIRRNI